MICSWSACARNPAYHCRRAFGTRSGARACAQEHAPAHVSRTVLLQQFQLAAAGCIEAASKWVLDVPLLPILDVKRAFRAVELDGQPHVTCIRQHAWTAFLARRPTPDPIVTHVHEVRIAVLRRILDDVGWLRIEARGMVRRIADVLPRCSVECCALAAPSDHGIRVPTS